MLVSCISLVYCMGQSVNKLQPNHDSFQEEAEEEDILMKEWVKISSRNSYGDCGDSIRDFPSYVTLCVPMLLYLYNFKTIMLLELQKMHCRNWPTC